MIINRSYFNASNELLRVDEVSIPVSMPTLKIKEDGGLKMDLGGQTVKTTNIHSGTNTYPITDRVVAVIEIIGKYEECDTSGPPYNFEWAQKTLGNGQVVRIDMSNLPQIGDSV